MYIGAEGWRKEGNENKMGSQGTENINLNNINSTISSLYAKDSSIEIYCLLCFHI